MWKKKISRDTAISLIKSQRSCIEINLGFLFQLSKFEGFLNYKENKLFIFKTNGTISLMGINDYFDIIFNEEVYFVLVLHDEKYYKICNGNLKISELIDEKFTNFVDNLNSLMKVYININSFVYKNQTLNEKDFKLRNLLESDILEEIRKYCISY